MERATGRRRSGRPGCLDTPGGPRIGDRASAPAVATGPPARTGCRPRASPVDGRLAGRPDTSRRPRRPDIPSLRPERDLTRARRHDRTGPHPDALAAAAARRGAGQPRPSLRTPALTMTERAQPKWLLDMPKAPRTPSYRWNGRRLPGARPDPPARRKRYAR